jgi:hypothetical protein
MVLADLEDVITTFIIGHVVADQVGASHAWLAREKRNVFRDFTREHAG